MAEQDTADHAQPVTNPLSINGLRSRTYHSRLSLIKEIRGKAGSYRAFLVAYRSDSLKVYARINLPSKVIPERGFSVVVFAHGFSPDPVDPAYFQRPYYENWINAYAEAGFCVIMPGYRGHAVIDGVKAEGGEYLERYASLYLTSPFYAIDVMNMLAGLPELAAMDWSAYGIASGPQPLIDLNNLFLAAHSMGGDVALVVLAVNNCFKAASIWAGVCTGLREVTQFYTRYELRESNSAASFETAFQDKWRCIASAVKQPPFLLEELDAANGYYHLEKITAPLILHHGTADTAVPAEWSSLLNQRLAALGKESQLHLYQGNNHELSLMDQNTLAIARDVAFFTQHTWKGQ